MPIAVLSQHTQTNRLALSDQVGVMRSFCQKGLAVVACLGVMIGLARAAAADVISTWNERAVAIADAAGWSPPQAERVMAMTHVAMFDAVNSIGRAYRPYLVQLPAVQGARPEVAAASAGATILAAAHPPSEPATRAALEAYLATLPDGPAKEDAIRLGRAVAAKILEARASDDSGAPDTYRPRTTSCVYVPTPPTVAPQWPALKPFAMTSPSQFRPAPPVKLTDATWVADYNEIKALGARNSTVRTARQTEDARFWVASDGRVYYPVIRTIVASRDLRLLDSARLFALVAVARADAMIAVFEAKYHYNFWRPMTAIRNGDIDDNPATERDAAWLPLDNTPMHPEYPCAHCILGASLGGVVELVLGGPAIPEVSLVSPTLPGVTHRWTNIRDLYREVAEARIAAGFHYRFSTKVGTDMGLALAAHVVRTVMQPLP